MAVPIAARGLAGVRRAVSKSSRCAVSLLVPVTDPPLRVERSHVCRIPTDKDRVLAGLARPVEEAGRTGACCVVRKAEDGCS